MKNRKLIAFILGTVMACAMCVACSATSGNESSQSDSTSESIESEDSSQSGSSDSGKEDSSYDTLYGDEDSSWGLGKYPID